LKKRLDASRKVQAAAPFWVYFSSVSCTRQDHWLALDSA
jgi:hypothetical protein